ncbi:hypothetical protein TNCT_661531, partial [Trichonephila clavata]
MKPKSKKALQKGSWNNKEYAVIQNYRKLQGNKGGKSLLPKQNHFKGNNRSFLQKAMVTYQEKKAIIEEAKR